MTKIILPQSYLNKVKIEKEKEIEDALSLSFIKEKLNEFSKLDSSNNSSDMPTGYINNGEVITSFDVESFLVYCKDRMITKRSLDKEVYLDWIFSKI